MGALEECHTRLGRLLGSEAEPIEVLRCAEEHRELWRPRNVRIVLLAEPHVYTAASELDRRAENVPDLTGTEVPRGFVRLVYCLGYGENTSAFRSQKCHNPKLDWPGRSIFRYFVNTMTS